MGSTMRDARAQLTRAWVVYLIQIPILVAYELGVVPLHPIAIVLPLVGFLNSRVDRRGADGLGLRLVPQRGWSLLLIAVFAALGLGGKLAALRLDGVPLRALTFTAGTMRSLAVDLVVDVFIIALWEEIVSRGYIQTRLQNAWGFRGVLVATLLFASLHLPSALHDDGSTAATLSRFGQVLLGGFLLGYAYWLTRSVWVTIALHGLRNFLALSLMVHLSGVTGAEVQATQIGFQLLWLVGEVGLMVLMGRVLFQGVPATLPLSGKGSVRGLRGATRILERGSTDDNRV